MQWMQTTKLSQHNYLDFLRVNFGRFAAEPLGALLEAPGTACATGALAFDFDGAVA